MESSADARTRDDGAVILNVDLGLAALAGKAEKSAGAVSFDGARRGRGAFMTKSSFAPGGEARHNAAIGK
jgi:hypothetical protein